MKAAMTTSSRRAAPRVTACCDDLQEVRGTSTPGSKTTSTSPRRAPLTWSEHLGLDAAALDETGQCAPDCDAGLVSAMGFVAKQSSDVGTGQRFLCREAVGISVLSDRFKPGSTAWQR